MNGSSAVLTNALCKIANEQTWKDVDQEAHDHATTKHADYMIALNDHDTFTEKTTDANYRATKPQLRTALRWLNTKR